MSIIEEKWEIIKETIKNEYVLSDISYDTWIKPLSINKVDEEQKIVTVLVPSDPGGAQMLKYISSKYEKYFQVIISELAGITYDISFILEKDREDEAAKPENNIVYNINYENASLNSKYRFDTFVVGSNNKFAHSAALAVAESPGNTYNPLYIYGGAGLGKTHLIHSIGHFILKEHPDTKVLYITSEQFTNEVIESIRSGNAAKMNKLREKYRTVDVLLVDDIQFIIGKESTQEEFFHTFNVLHSNRKQVIITSDKPPKELEILEERFRSRFEWGLIADIQAPDYETRMAILRKNAEAYNKNIDDEIFKYIATNIKSNIRELEGAFNKIIAFSRLNKTELNMEDVEETLRDIIYPNINRQITPRLIINVVAEHYNIRPDDITSKRRNREFVIPRQVVMYLCRTHTDESFHTIGSLLGGKDHSTVMHGCAKIEKEMETNEELKNKVETIEKIIIPA